GTRTKPESRQSGPLRGSPRFAARSGDVAKHFGREHAAQRGRVERVEKERRVTYLRADRHNMWHVNLIGRLRPIDILRQVCGVGQGPLYPALHELEQRGRIE